MDTLQEIGPNEQLIAQGEYNYQVSGKDSGLTESWSLHMVPDESLLHRAVVVADSDNVIRYIELVPMSQLPNFERAYDAARSVLKSREP